VLQPDLLLLGALLNLRGGEEGLQLLQPVDPLGDGLEVGEHAAEPALVHIGHARTLRLHAHDVLGLLLGPHEEDRPAAHGQVLNEAERALQLLHGLLEVNDVDAVPLRVDVAGELGVPALPLVAEVDTGFQELLNRDLYGHIPPIGEGWA